MLAWVLILFKLAFCWLGIANGDTKICDFDDSKCLTETSARLFKEFVTGILGVPSSDPLNLDSFAVDEPSLKYTVTDANLSGVKNCMVETVRINAKDLKYDYHIGCPHLTLESGYEIKGEVGDQSVEGKGTSTADFYDYHFLFDGDVASKDGKNGTNHLHLKTHNLRTEVKGRAYYDYKNLFDGDKEKSEAFHKFVNENWQAVGKTIGQPVLDALMNIYINNVNSYLDVVPVQHLFSYET